MSQTFQSDVRRLAYDQTDGQAPGIVFLGGFRSDKNGTKALYLEDWAKARKRAYLRFDYSGHGASSGQFLDGTIGDWADDAAAIITGLTEGPQLLVGSSMGAWIALILAKRMPEKIAGLITVAAAPDFTEDSYWGQFSEGQRAMLERDGQIELPDAYDIGPNIITRKLISEGRNQLVLRAPLFLPFPTRFLHGAADETVPQTTAEALFNHAEGPDIRLTLVKGADHRFSTTSCLYMIGQAISDISLANQPDQPATS